MNAHVVYSKVSRSQVFITILEYCFLITTPGSGRAVNVITRVLPVVHDSIQSPATNQSQSRGSVRGFRTMERGSIKPSISHEDYNAGMSGM